MPIIHDPKMGILPFRGLTPKMESSFNTTPKGTPLRETRHMTYILSKSVTEEGVALSQE